MICHQYTLSHTLQLSNFQRDSLKFGPNIVSARFYYALSHFFLQVFGTDLLLGLITFSHLIKFVIMSCFQSESPLFQEVLVCPAFCFRQVGIDMLSTYDLYWHLVLQYNVIVINVLTHNNIIQQEQQRCHKMKWFICILENNIL